jgi:hypothetical protein
MGFGSKKTDSDDGGREVPTRPSGSPGGSSDTSGTAPASGSGSLAAHTDRPVAPASSSQTPAGPTAQVSQNDKAFERWTVRYPARFSAITALVGALIGGLVAGGATYLTVREQQRAQLAVFQEQREDAERKLRSDSYLAFLEAFDDYTLNIGPFSACLKLPNVELRQVEPCKSTLQSETAKYLRLQKAADGVRIHGSDVAVAVVSEFMDVVVDSETRTRYLEAQRLPETLDTTNAIHAFEMKKMNEIYSAPGIRKRFVALMCKELNPSPRTTC